MRCNDGRTRSRSSQIPFNGIGGVIEALAGRVLITTAPLKCCAVDQDMNGFIEDHIAGVEYGPASGCFSFVVECGSSAVISPGLVAAVTCMTSKAVMLWQPLFALKAFQSSPDTSNRMFM